MNQFELAKTILTKIVLKDIPFTIALRVSFKESDVEPQIKSNISALIGCELRHHLIFDNLVERYVGEVEFEKTIYLRFALANSLFLKRFNEEELYELSKEDIDEEKVDYIREFALSTLEIIPSELDKFSPEYLSMRYNTPTWVVRMWQKQFGKSIAFKTLKVNYRPSVSTVRIDETKVDKEAFLRKHPDFSTSTVDNILVFHGRGTPSYLEEFKDYRIFYMKMATKYLLDQLDLDPIKKYAVYSDVPNNIYLDLYTRFGKELKCDYICNHTKAYFETKKVLEDLSAPHLYLYEAGYSSVVTCLSSKANIFFCMPKNSTFDLFRSTPDYFLRVKQDELSNLIENESKALEECSKQVELDGELIYMVPTLSRKETSTLIANFLISHKDYELIEEKQFFPYEVFDSCLYYARLRKVKLEND